MGSPTLSRVPLVPDVDALHAELAELIAIPSVSADVDHRGDVLAAAEWVCDRILRAGGQAGIVDWHGSPLAVGEVRASSGAESAPTVLCYGHFDVQPADPLELWDTPPFELTRHDGWLYGRGIVDDKGQLFMLLKAVERLAAAGELPVNVRFACDGEEEIGGHSIVDWLAADERGADVALVFDGGMQRRGVPEFNVAMRGLCYFHVEVRTGARDLHSGIYGGAALNAMHALTQTLAVLLPRDGRLPEPLRAGIAPPSEEELSGWAVLQPGAEALSEQGARPADPRAAEEFYVRTWAEPSVDVHGLAGGSPHLIKTVLPVHAAANFSIRLVAGQDPQTIAQACERLLRDAAPPGADLELTLRSANPPALVPPDTPAVQLAQDAFEATVGTRPLLVRSGGSIPLAAALSERGIPAIITGFSLPDSNLHSPNERLVAEYLPLGVETVEEILRRFAALPRD
jgi:acetylornithine deacetylase/succinyl-diaminopimelate desuccinylase-like protein